MLREQPKRPRRRIKVVPPPPMHLGSRFGEWFTARDVRGFAAISGLPEMVAEAKQVATELDDAIDAAAAAAGVAAVMPTRDELLKILGDLADTADEPLAMLGLLPGLSDNPIAYRPNEATPWVARLGQGVSGDHLQRLHGLIASSFLWNLYLPNRRPSANVDQRVEQISAAALQALKAVPLHIGLLSELARFAYRLEADVHRDPPHGNADTFRHALFRRLRMIFRFAFGIPPAYFKDGERDTPAVEWHMAVLKHAAERRQQVTDDADMTALDHLAELKRPSVATYMQKAASRDRKARKTGKG